MKIELEITDQLVRAVADAVVVRLQPRLTGSRHEEQRIDDLMEVEKLGRYLGVSKDWVYQRTAKNEIPFLKIGNLIRFRRSDIDKWLAKHSVPDVSPLSAPLPLEKARDK